MAKLGGDLRNRGSAADRMACTNVSTAELTLSAVTSGAWVMRTISLSGVPDYFGRNKISSGGDLSHYSSASLY